MFKKGIYNDNNEIVYISQQYLLEACILLDLEQQHIQREIECIDNIIYAHDNKICLSLLNILPSLENKVNDSNFLEFRKDSLTSRLDLIKYNAAIAKLIEHSRKSFGVFLETFRLLKTSSNDFEVKEFFRANIFTLRTNKDLKELGFDSKK